MRAHRRHLSDDRLVAVCLEDAALPAERQHLESCDACVARRDRLARTLADVSATLTAEADAAFDAERLARQRARILQRIEQAGRPGRLIAFPASPVHCASLRARSGVRWVAGAAAAGLIIGILTGHLVHVLPGPRAPVSGQAAGSRPAPELHAVSTTLSEEEFLGMLDVAIEGAGGASLRPLDDLTPGIWEIAAAQ
ncbi:MAG: hypothetical protein HY824_16565 [Acidobacteria bacterium]|nr:hypothetical protein [Acidobacteriota bacterium]